jgi:hypothetical protein
MQIFMPLFAHGFEQSIKHLFTLPGADEVSGGIMAAITAICAEGDVIVTCKSGQGNNLTHPGHVCWVGWN